MIKELPFVEPEIITFVYEAYPLGIMKANGIDYKKWLYSNYIQINCHDDIVKEKEVFNVFYGEVGINAPYLNVQKYSLDFLKRADMDLIQFFKKCIELDCYVYLKMDEFYIPQRDEYRKETFIHDEMITGYDESGFGVLGYDDKGKISKMILGFDEFLLAVSSNDSVYQKRMWADDVFVITPIKNSYELNINLIKRSLFDYLIRFLNDDYSLGENLYKDYRSINELANIIHMQAIKYEMCPSKLLLEKMKETVRRIREDDNKVLSELYSRLECVC